MPILLSRMFDKVRVESGKWLTKKVNLEMKAVEFALLAESAVETYNQYRPWEKSYAKIQAASDGRVQFFITSPQYGIPRDIGSVVPSIQEPVYASFAAIFGFTKLNRLKNNSRVHYSYIQDQGLLLTDYAGSLDIESIFDRTWLPVNLVESAEADPGNVGNGTISSVSVLSGVQPQTFTLEALSNTQFSVTGSETTRLLPNVTVGTPYAYDIGFTLIEGVTPFSVGDIFTVVIQENPEVEQELLFYDPGKDELLVQLTTARFLKSLGSSRRSFRHNDLPVTDDGDQMVSDGQTLEQYCMDKLASHSSWYNAMRL